MPAWLLTVTLLSGSPDHEGHLCSPRAAVGVSFRIASGLYGEILSGKMSGEGREETQRGVGGQTD